MYMLTLTITERTAQQTLPEGVMPAVFYGRKEESTPISIVRGEFEKILRQAGESTIIILSGVGEDKEALIHDIAFHPVTGVPQHADLYVIEKGKKLTVSVPFEFIGESPVVKSEGGTLIKVMYELEIEALPKDLPHQIEVDLSSLTTFDSTITIGDISLPKGVEPTEESTETVVSVTAPREEEEEEESTEIDMDSIQVEKKGKDEPESDESGSADEDGE